VLSESEIMKIILRIIAGVTLSILASGDIGLKDEIKIYRLKKQKGSDIEFSGSRLPSETRILIYQYKNSPCNIKRKSG